LGEHAIEKIPRKGKTDTDGLVITQKNRQLIGGVSLHLHAGVFRVGIC